MRRFFLLTYKTALKIFSGYGIGNFYLVKVIKNFIISLLKTNYAEVLGHKMFLDSKDSLCLSVNGIYDPLTVELVNNEIKNGDIVLDIGANIGYYTLIFAKLTGQGGKVFAFEPEPTNFSLLKKNVEINGYKNVEFIQKAVSDKIGNAKLYLCEYNKGCHTIYDPNDGRKSIEIETISLDEYFKNYTGKIDFIKIDIEGAEWLALKGMLNLLENYDLKIVTEFAPILIKKFGIEPKEYLNLILQLGFKIHIIDEFDKRIKPVSIQQLLDRYLPDKEDLTNLFCTKEK